MPRQASRPNLDDADNGNGSDPDVGERVDRCSLGDDCPYAGSMRWLANERLKREQVEGELAGTVDRLADEVKRATLSVQALKNELHELDGLVKAKTQQLEATLSLKIIELDAALKAHTRSHRWIELLVMGLAMGFGSAVTRWIGGK